METYDCPAWRLISTLCGESATRNLANRSMRIQDLYVGAFPIPRCICDFVTVESVVTESSTGPRKRFREMTVAHVGVHGWVSPGSLMIILVLFLQKQSLASAVYLFGLGTLLTGPGLKKKHMR